jgi:hypothetical protein
MSFPRPSAAGRRPARSLRAALVLLAVLAVPVACTLERHEVGLPGDDAAEPDDGASPDGSCPDGFTACAGECVELATDLDHCGGCGAACGVHGDCAEGICTCEPGFGLCPDGCVNSDIDRANCGGCGVACDEGETCRRGECA